MTFDEALKVWALRYLNKEVPRLNAVEILAVNITYQESSGYCETCWDPAHINIDIGYVNSDGEVKEFWDYDYSSIVMTEFELLQELFKED